MGPRILKETKCDHEIKLIQTLLLEELTEEYKM